VNERIKQLAKHAGLKIEYQMINPPKPLQILGSAEQFEKFAELIIKECAEVGLDSVEDGDNLDAIMKRVHNNILEHFGVEE
jgi:acetylornithine deacetylase/succinyl-diaminopimelate desuccinylase-like protein